MSQVSICENIISKLLIQFETNVKSFKYSRYDKVIYDENLKALTLTRMLKSGEICDECWASLVIQIGKFQEIRQVFQFLPDNIKETLAFPRDKFEVEGCLEGCYFKISQNVE